MIQVFKHLEKLSFLGNEYKWNLGESMKVNKWTMMTQAFNNLEVLRNVSSKMCYVDLKSDKKQCIVVQKS